MVKNVTTGHYHTEHVRPLDLNLIEIHNNAIPQAGTVAPSEDISTDGASGTSLCNSTDFQLFLTHSKNGLYQKKIVGFDLVFPLKWERGGFIKLGVALHLQFLLKMGFSRPNIFILTHDVQIKFRSSFTVLHFRMKRFL